LDEHQREHLVDRLTRRLEHLGDRVSLEPVPAASCGIFNIAQVVCKSLQHCRNFSTPVFHLYEEYLLNSGSLVTKLMAR